MRKILIYGGIIIGFFIIGVVIANFIIMPLIVHQGKVVAVPQVVHMTLDNAIAELSKRDLEGIVVERRFDPIVEEGRIVIQDPLPETRVKTGRIVNLTVSLGPETIRVPFLIGVDAEKAELIVKRLGFTIEAVNYQHSDTVAANKIIATTPVAETELKKGDGIILVVSKGPVLKMPTLSGMTVEQVMPLLDSMGLVLGEIKEVEGSGTTGSVIIQNPAPDNTVERGDTVTLMVIK
jgi:beta-lactam-binding protein with PASTA domain